MAFRARREENGFSQEGFADHIGMHRAYYGALERGKKDLQLSTLQRVCEGLKVRMWEVVREAEE
jgi:transcriptional regulator with XRE-family HTH domain